MSQRALDELEVARREAMTERATPNELAGAMLVGLVAHLESTLDGVAHAKVVFGSRDVAMAIHRGLEEIVGEDRFLYGKLESFSNKLLELATMGEPGKPSPGSGEANHGQDSQLPEFGITQGGVMNAQEFLEQQAERFGLTVSKANDGDFDMRVSRCVPPCTAYDLIQLTALLHEAEYMCIFMKDNSIHVHAPHRKEHSWGDRGWTCTHGLTVAGCEKFKIMEEFKDQDSDKLIGELQAAIKGRDACVGQLYASIAQGRIDKLLMVLNGRSLTDTQKLRMGLRGRQMTR